MSLYERANFAALVAEQAQRKVLPFNSYFPDEGRLSRDKYPRSQLFWLAGLLHRERIFLAANRVGKTVTAAFETTAHLTGRYPAWWPGRQFEHPTEWWAAGDTLETTRNVIQFELCGPRDAVRHGRYAGMLPPHLIADRTLKSGGVPDVIDTLWIQHVERHHGAPLFSTLEFKAYNQGRLSFQGTSKHGIWLDEEPPDISESGKSSDGGTPVGDSDIYTECLLRTATTEGLIMATFTPLRGLTPFLEQYLEQAEMVNEQDQIVNAKAHIFGRAA